ncbi:hypothetical protein KI387_001960, partial [Taxus chinensis]
GEGRVECREGHSSFRGATLSWPWLRRTSQLWGEHVAPAIGVAPQSATASAAGAGPRDPSWRPSDP